MGLVEVLSELDGYRSLLRKKGQLWSFLQRLGLIVMRIDLHRGGWP